MINLTVRELKNLICNNSLNIKNVLNLINISKCTADNEEDNIVELLGELHIEARICSVCKKIIISGYCIYDGEEYACSDECLHTFMTDGEFVKAYNDGNGDTFITDWTETTEDGVLLESDVFYNLDEECDLLEEKLKRMTRDEVFKYKITHYRRPLCHESFDATKETLIKQILISKRAFREYY